LIRYVSIALLLLATFLGAQAGDELIDQAVQLYETRHLDAADLKQSYDILDRVVAEDSGNLRANCALSYVCYLLGDGPQSGKEKLKYYDKGYGRGRKAIEIDRGSADAHLWYVVNRGRQGQTRGVLNSLFMVPEIEREVGRVLEIDPENTVALDVKAMLYYELPSFYKGDLKKSLAALNQAVALDSNYALLYVDMAKVQIRLRNYERARWYLNRCLAIENPTYLADFVLDDKPDAERLLKETEAK
jgi:tetratricopeptide (TPR) repeat protein